MGARRGARHDDRGRPRLADPALGRLIEIAYRNNYTLKVAGLKVLEARAQLGIAVGSLYPQVQQANGSATYTQASKNAANTASGDLGFWEYNVGASVGWELDFWGKYRRNTEAARAGRFGRYQCEAAIQSVHAQRAITGRMTLRAIQAMLGHADLYKSLWKFIGKKVHLSRLSQISAKPNNIFVFFSCSQKSLTKSLTNRHLLDISVK